VHHGVVERIDPFEVVRIQDVLRTDLMGRFRAEIGLEQPQNRPENGQTGQAQLSALVLETIDQGAPPPPRLRLSFRSAQLMWAQQFRGEAVDLTTLETAEALFIHRNTLQYRMDRIAEIASIDLDNPETRLALQLAIKAHRLLNAKME